MMTPALRAAVAAVRWWTRLYTVRLPRAIRDSRRAEIESDLWEFLHDASWRDRAPSAPHVVFRLVAGLPHDLCWRLEQAPVLRRAPRRLVALTTLALVLSAAWMLWLLRADVLPQPPVSPMAWTSRRPPAPPPPPPPPCRPPGFTGGCEQPGALR